MQIITKMFFCGMLLFVTACTSLHAEQALITAKEPKSMQHQEQPMIITNTSWQQVTVKYLSFEGGFYGLISEKGAKLLPMNLPEKYQVDGTILRVKGQPIKNMMTIQQWGKPFKVIETELVKMGSGTPSKSNHMI